jgi:steroid delta-isomerase-like uncharacterized protein
MSAEYVALARRWFDEVWNQRRRETIDDLIAPESVCQAAGGELRGPTMFQTHVYEPFVDAFPDLRVTVEGTVAEGDQVVVRWTATGTHTGPGIGLVPTGRPIFLRGMTWIRFAGGKMVEGWDCWNQREMIESLR